MHVLWLDNNKGAKGYVTEEGLDSVRALKESKPADNYIEYFVNVDVMNAPRGKKMARFGKASRPTE